LEGSRESASSGGRKAHGVEPTPKVQVTKAGNPAFAGGKNAAKISSYF